jgi:hypothetical protein
LRRTNVPERIRCGKQRAQYQVCFTRDNAVRADVHRHHRVAFKVKRDSQVCFDFRRLNDPPITGRELVDFVRMQARIKRIPLKDEERCSRLLLLFS